MSTNNWWLDYRMGRDDWNEYSDVYETIKNNIDNAFLEAPMNHYTADNIYMGRPHAAYTHVVNMTPDDYLKQSYNTYKPNPVETWEDFLKRVEQATYKKGLVDKMANGTKLDMLELDYNSKGLGAKQEGNHRAMAAKLLGKDTVPVAITTEVGKEGSSKALRKNIQKALRFGDIIPTDEFSKAAKKIGPKVIKALDTADKYTRGLSAIMIPQSVMYQFDNGQGQVW